MEKEKGRLEGLGSHDPWALDILRLGRKSILERVKPIALKVAEENLSLIEDSMSSWEFELVSRFVGSLRTNLVKGQLTHKYLILM